MDGEGNDPMEAPPSFSSPQPPPGTPSGSPSTFGGPPAGLPTVPPPLPDHPAHSPSGPPAWRASLFPAAGPDDGARPAPTLTSMLAVGGGLLTATGLVFLLGELDGYDQRFTGLALSFIFLVLGVAISVINRSTRAAAAGVAISVFAVVPMTVYLWANADLFGTFSGGDVDGNPYDGIRGVVTIMLLTAAVVWLVGYVFGPGRKFGVYLGAALVALWLIPMFNLQINAIEDTFSPFSVGSTFEPVPSPDLDSGFDSGFDSEFDSEFDSGFDSSTGFEEDVTFEEPEISDPSTKMGVASLVFGAAYLVFAAWRDRKGDARMATAALAPSILILLYATGLLTGHVGWVGWAVLSMAVGGALLAVGLRGRRRASSWIGLVLATYGLGSLVVEGLGESPRATGALLAVLGVAIAVAVGRTAPPTDDPAPAPSSIDADGPSGAPTADDAPLATPTVAPAAGWAQPAAPTPSPADPVPPGASPWGRPASPAGPGTPGTPGAPGPQSF